MVFEKVKEITIDQLGCEDEEVTMNATFESLHADELDVVEIVMSCEDEYNFEISDEVVDELKTVGDLVKYLENRIG